MSDEKEVLKLRAQICHLRLENAEAKRYIGELETIIAQNELQAVRIELGRIEKAESLEKDAAQQEENDAVNKDVENVRRAVEEAKGNPSVQK